jgi:hypothetical protein
MNWRLAFLALAAVLLLVCDESGAADRRGGRFSKDMHGVIRDKETGLEWFVGPNQDMTWRQAEAWAKGAPVNGGGWRLPTIAELRTLLGSGEYRPEGKDYSIKIDPIFQYGACCPWSCDTRDAGSAWLFDLDDGAPKPRARGNSYDGPPIAVRLR